MELISVDGAQLEVEVRGSGEPVVLIQTALLADEFVPLAQQPQLRDSFQTVLYHRRGYAGSSPVDGPGSIAHDAADCLALLGALGIERAHVVSLSYSGPVALQLALDAPEQVHSLDAAWSRHRCNVPSGVSYARERTSAAGDSPPARVWRGARGFLTLVIGPEIGGSPPSAH